jgi:hypothetical protein
MKLNKPSCYPAQDRMAVIKPHPKQAAALDGGDDASQLDQFLLHDSTVVVSPSSISMSANDELLAEPQFRDARRTRT